MQILICLLALTSLVKSDYFVGRQGESCYLTCFRQNLECSGSIETNNSTKLFNQLGVSCKANPTVWWANDQPAYITDQSDPNYGECLGYMGVPGQVWCGGNYKGSRRLCNCVGTTADDQFFGTGYSNGILSGVEQDIFTKFVTPGHTGVMTHFWATAMENVMALTMVRYYIDGETTASIQFIPSLAAGVGFEDPQAPWGNKWIGKGAKDGAWYINFRIPFQKSIRITTQSTDGKNYGGFYIIVRGAQDVPIEVAGIKVPSNARLVQQVFSKSVAPLTYIPVADFPTGKGVFLMHTLSVRSGNPNFLEGCYHAYSPYNQAYPGTVVSTGTEDYFDSAWYFNGGEFHLDNAGFTHWKQASASVLEFSAYRFHDTDPLQFSNGFKFVWRNGDTVNPKTGLKCFEETGGATAGSPTVSDVLIYSWTYTWQ